MASSSSTSSNSTQPVLMATSTPAAIVSTNLSPPSIYMTSHIPTSNLSNTHSSSLSDVRISLPHLSSSVPPSFPSQLGGIYNISSSPISISSQLPSLANTISPTHQTPHPQTLLPSITTLVTIKLNGDNYLVWRSQMETVLSCYDLLGYVDGSVPCLSRLVADPNGAPTLNPLLLAWTKMDQCVRACLTATLTYDLHKEVHDLKSAREVWQSLHRRFLDQCIAKELNLKFQFHNMSKKSGQSMTDYLREIKEIADSLIAINCSISDKDLVIQALNGLPSEYDSFICTYGSMGSHLSFQDLKGKLLTLEERLTRSSSNSTTDFAFYTSTSGSSSNHGGRTNRGRGGSGRGGSGRGGPGRGRSGRGGSFRSNWQSSESSRNSANHGAHQWRTNFQGHGGSSFPIQTHVTAQGQRHSTPNNSSGATYTPPFQNRGILGSRPIIQCQLCNEHDHTAANCPQRFNHAFLASTDIVDSFSALSVGETTNNTWYLDSGASAHLTNNPGQTDRDTTL